MILPLCLFFGFLTDFLEINLSGTIKERLNVKSNQLKSDHLATLFLLIKLHFLLESGIIIKGER